MANKAIRSYFGMPTQMEPDEVRVEITVIGANANAMLSHLTVSTGELKPTFSPIHYNYTVSVDNAIDSITLTTTPYDSNAKVSGDGLKQLQVGVNSFTITVMAEDETTIQNYIVTINREDTVCNISGITQNTFVQVYPNPTNGQLVIDNGQWTIENIGIFDIYGRKVKQFSTFNSQLSIEDMPAGVYFLRVETEKESITKKIIKK